MAFTINLGLDPELPLMVWSDASLLYPLDYVLTSAGRMLPATEARIQKLVDTAIRATRSALAITEERVDSLYFRDLVIDTLCREFRFIYGSSASRVILSEEIARGV